MTSNKNPDATARKSPIRVLLADDHQIVRDGIKALLGDDKTIQFPF